MGLDIDPTPGDPVLVLAGGREYLDVAQAIDDAAAAMARLDVAGTVSAAVDAVMDRKEDVIADELNDRPRAVLGYLTPREVFEKLLIEEAVA